MHERLMEAVSAVPGGAWAVAVSGGADSVALLALLRRRADLSLVVVHLDHQTRGGESARDAAFVAALAGRWGLRCVVGRRAEVESQPSLSGGSGRWPLRNPQARFRAARLALFRQVVTERELSGVILGHHADDQAETVLHRLLRGAGPAGPAGMSPRATIGGLLVLRPLLDVPATVLRQYLNALHQEWREDPTNRSPRYLRNRLRRVLHRHSMLTEALLDLGAACAEVRNWTKRIAPRLPPRFRTADAHDLPEPLLNASLCRWLAERGVPRAQVTPAAVAHLKLMIQDAASAPRRHFPGGLLIRRRRGWIEPG